MFFEQRAHALEISPADGATWTHVAATFDGAQLRLYLDGVLDAELWAPGEQAAKPETT